MGCCAGGAAKAPAAGGAARGGARPQAGAADAKESPLIVPAHATAAAAGTAFPAERAETRCGSSAGASGAERVRYEGLKVDDAERAVLQARLDQKAFSFKRRVDRSFLHSDGLTEQQRRDEQIVVRIQRVWRGLRITRRFRSALFRIVWKALEAYDERAVAPPTPAVKARKKGGDPNSPLGAGERGVSFGIDVCDDSLLQAVSGVSALPEDLKYPAMGIAVQDPRVQKKIVEKLVGHLHRGIAIPEQYIRALVEEATPALRARPNVQRVSLSDTHGKQGRRLLGPSVPQANRCIVVGDLHGHLDDLLHIIDEKWYRLPEKVSNKYIFNGDFVDRGDNSVEVLCLLLVLFLAFPGSVYLNRGNHEGMGCSSMYGFYHELVSKYETPRELFASFVQLFTCLPLCAVVESEVLVVHGGPPRTTKEGEHATLADIAKIDRFREIPCVRPTTAAQHTREDILLADLLWSDPDRPPEGGPAKPGAKARPPASWAYNATRSNGIVFRPAHSDGFCQRNGLRAIVRSHEAVDAGFLRHAAHAGRVYTVFSASNYCGLEGNDAAVAVLSLGADADAGASATERAGKVGISFNSWCMHLGGVDEPGWQAMRAAGRAGGAAMQRARALEVFAQAEVLRLLQELIHRQRHEIAMELCEKDADGAGEVSAAAWGEAMARLMPVPWHALRPALVNARDEGAIPWMSGFLRRYHCRLEDRMIQRWAPYILNWILARAKHMAEETNNQLGGTAAEMFDREVPKGDSRGMSYRQVFHVLKEALNTMLPTELIFLIFCHLDGLRGEAAVNGRVQRDDWVRAFRQSEAHALCMHEKQLGADHDPRVTNDFVLWDWWLLQRFRELFHGMPDPISAFRLMDNDRDKSLGVKDLQKGISILHLAISQQPGFRKLVSVFLGAGDQVAAMADLMGVGPEWHPHFEKSRTTDYGAVIQTWPPLESQLDAFVALLDHDGDGRVSYRDFIMSFYIRDRVEDEAALARGGAPVLWHEFSGEVWDNWDEKSLSQRRQSMRPLRSMRSMRSMRMLGGHAGSAGAGAGGAGGASPLSSIVGAPPAGDSPHPLPTPGGLAGLDAVQVESPAGDDSASPDAPAFLPAALQAKRADFGATRPDLAGDA